MENPLISVIVPIYKVETYLDECLLSLVSQTYTNLEIILVDDGSPDNCPLKCDEWAKRDSRIKVIHKLNGGLSDARNAGVEVATGDYIAFVDSDDFVDVRLYEVLLGAFRRYPDIICSTACIYKYCEGKIETYQTRWHISEETFHSCFQFAELNISESCSFPVWNKLYKSEIVKRIKFRTNHLNEDTLYDFDLGKLLKREYRDKTYVELPYYGYYYRIRANSICNTVGKPLIVDVLSNLEEMLSEKDNNSELTEVLNERYHTKVFSFVEHIINDEFLYNSYYKIYRDKLMKLSTKKVLSYLSFKQKIKYIFIRYLPNIWMFIRKYM